MRILALVPSPADMLPGQRYRIEQWAPLLRARGVELTFQPLKCEALHELLCRPGNHWRKLRLTLRAIARRARALSTLREYDAVYLYSEASILGPAFFERLIRRSGVPLVFDFDDAIFLRCPSPISGHLRLLKFPAKTRAICRLSSHVMVGNAYLAEYAGRFNSRVSVVPSTIDLEKYRTPAPRVSSGPPVIGWTGSHSTVRHIESLRGVLRRLARREPFRLRVIGAPEFQLEGVAVEAVPWNSQTEVADLSQVDIGVMPLPDDPWTRGKCGMKALQFMALGVPVVCSPVGVNAHIVRDGENGYLAADEDEWLDKLTLLLRSPALRNRLGARGRLTVEAEFSSARQSPRVYEIFASVAAHSPGLSTEHPSPHREAPEG
jgi:glycosyltransferase involved in cell wall biosynthesis